MVVNTNIYFSSS